MLLCFFIAALQQGYTVLFCWTLTLLLHCTVFVAALQQSYTALKEHAQHLESSLADHASTEVRRGSEVRTELDRKEQELGELTEELERLKASLVKEQQAVKDVKDKVCVPLKLLSSVKINLITVVN